MRKDNTTTSVRPLCIQHVALQTNTPRTTGVPREHACRDTAHTSRGLGRILEHAMDATGAKGAWIGLFDYGTATIRPVVSHGIDAILRRKLGVRLKEIPPSGALRLAAVTRETQLVHDVLADPRGEYDRDELRKRGFTCSAVSPLLDGSELLGVLVAYATEARAFGRAESRLLEAFASQAVAAIVSARALDQAGQQVKELEGISAITQRLSGNLSLEQKLNEALDVIIDVLGADGGAIYLTDRLTGDAVLTSHRGIPAYAIPEARKLAPGTGLSGWVIKHGAPLVVEDVQKDIRLTVEWIKQERVHFFASVPLISSAQALGALCVWTRGPKSKALGNEQFLLVIGNQIGIAVENSALYRDMLALQNERIHLLRECLWKTTNAHEEERARLARELHDEVAQGLVSGIVEVNLMRTRLTGAGKLAMDLQALADALKGILGRSRRIVHGLRSTLGRETTFVEALRDELLAQTRAETGALCSIEVSDWPTSLEDEVAINLYRVIQEALANVKRHSQATSVWLKLQRGADESLVVIVQDNGIGFDVSCLQNVRFTREHFGILGMKERVSLMQGELQITSEPGLGTSVEIRVPRAAPASQFAQTVRGCTDDTTC